MPVLLLLTKFDSTTIHCKLSSRVGVVVILYLYCFARNGSSLWCQGPNGYPGQGVYILVSYSSTTTAPVSFQSQEWTAVSRGYRIRHNLACKSKSSSVNIDNPSSAITPSHNPASLSASSLSVMIAFDFATGVLETFDFASPSTAVFRFFL